MSIQNKILASLVTVGLICAPVLSQAGARDLTIKNNAKTATSCVLNGGLCSSHFPGGVTQAGQTNRVDENLIALACFGSIGGDCKALVFMNGDCKAGGDIGTVVFNTKTGIKSIGTVKPGYAIKGSGFTITICDGSTPTCE